MHILITGDSWGRGEWGPDASGKYSNTHPGLQAYLEQDGHSVDNVSKPGGHNKEAYDNMMSVLHSKHDIILWLKADPLRDLMPENYDPIRHDFTTYAELLSESKKLSARAYARFAGCGKPVHCLGGGGKLDINMMSRHDTLIPLVPSITEFVLREHGYQHPELWASDWIFLIDRRFDIESIERLLANKKQQDLLGSHPNYKRYFYPDGDHPNRQGWRIIYDHIKPMLGL